MKYEREEPAAFPQITTAQQQWTQWKEAGILI